MSKSLARIWIHATFSTKDRVGTIRGPFAEQLHLHLRDQLLELKCNTVLVNGHLDHVHLLFQAPPDKAVTEIIRRVKGESAHWVNSCDLVKGKFVWQNGYAAFSVSESNVARVRAYINNQEKHHAKTSFEDELNELLLRHGLVDSGTRGSR